MQVIPCESDGDYKIVLFVLESTVACVLVGDSAGGHQVMERMWALGTDTSRLKFWLFAIAV